MRRALAAGVVAVTLAGSLGGCSAAEHELEARLAELPQVVGAFVWTTASGAPWNRGYAVRLYVGDEPVSDLAGLVDDALRLTWEHAAFEPTNGIALEVSRGDRPAEPHPGRPGDQVMLHDAVPEIPPREGRILVATSGESVDLPRWALEARYGPWGDGR